MGYATAQAALQSRLGIRVDRAAADILDSVQNPLFTVAGGHILLTHIEATVSVAAVDAGACNTQFLTNPTVGADMAICAVLNVISAAIGAIFSVSGTIADAMTGLVPGGGAPAMTRPIIVPVGTIDLKSSADRGTGGALVAVSMWYIPLDAGAYVTAT